MEYKVCRGGQVLMQTELEDCRYPREIEAELIASGHDIIIDGKKLKPGRRKEVEYRA